ncbi:hypothetical protein MA16_Dca018999 [Dendrobium catenatum]|uniref:Uncharacterized protein n=1 Tax=Dendrobium catenatum TaxID=906689 RepID=A0A2I0VM14_9ASPA|nr:hypothetical protein MA16_Dca018999 [Dendrobium catenatum]
MQNQISRQVKSGIDGKFRRFERNPGFRKSREHKKRATSRDLSRNRRDEMQATSFYTRNDAGGGKSIGNKEAKEVLEMEKVNITVNDFYHRCFRFKCHKFRTDERERHQGSEGCRSKVNQIRNGLRRL